MYMGPKVPYDLTGYTGITFWAMSSTTADNKLRVKIPMTDETKIADGGSCDEDRRRRQQVQRRLGAWCSRCRPTAPGRRSP